MGETVLEAVGVGVLISSEIPPEVDREAPVDLDEGCREVDVIEDVADVKIGDDE